MVDGGCPRLDRVQTLGWRVPHCSMCWSGAGGWLFSLILVLDCTYPRVGPTRGAPTLGMKICAFVLRCIQEDTFMNNTTTVTVRVPAALKNRLDKLADATARSRSWLAAHALEVYVEDQEWQLATIRKGKKDVQASRVVSHEGAARWLRSWGKKRELPPPSCE